MNNTWALVVTAKASIENIKIFLDHHLKLGVNEIFLFLDSPEDFNNIDELNINEKIKIFPCTDEFWRTRDHYEILDTEPNKKPKAVEQRQYHNMLHAQDVSKSEWIMMIDIDELLYSGERINEILSEIPTNVFSVRAAPLEAVYLENKPKNLLEVFNTSYFKNRFVVNYSFWNEIYKNKYLNHKSGFFGHVTGKTFHRVNVLIRSASCHISRPYDTDLMCALDNNRFFILHFESMTQEFFIEKNLKRISNEFYVPFLEKKSKERLSYFKENYEKDGEGFLEKIYMDMHVFNTKTMNKCLESGYITNINFYEFKDEAYIETYHGTIIVFNREKEEVVAIRKEDFNKNLHCKVLIYNTLDGNNVSQKAYLYTKVDGKVCYLYLNNKNKITLINTKKAQLFEFIRNKSFFSLGLNGKFLKCKKNNEVKLEADIINNWELFKVNF
ncbi:glycosyltransferase family 2 protein [Acinetobacter pecorum]|uniref:glycosyltransferase family 2 protein n=1 Tax=Acinetobacter pecorum TaxID=2762215 RepID=UPI0011A35FAE